MKNSLKIVSLVVMFSLLLVMTACSDYEEDKNIEINDIGLSNELLEDEENKSNGQGNDENNEEVSPLYSSTYKLFYGEWEITEVLGYDYHLGKSYPEADAMIGTRISYSKTEIETNDLKIDKFDFSYTINPNIKNSCYFNKTLTNEELGIKGEYYVFVHVETYIHGVNYGIDFVGDEFFIVDDKTLILVRGNVFYLAKRVSYENGLDEDEMTYTHI